MLQNSLRELGTGKAAIQMCLWLQGPSLGQAVVLLISRHTLSCSGYTHTLPPFLYIIIQANEEEKEEEKKSKWTLMLGPIFDFVLPYDLVHNHFT